MVNVIIYLESVHEAIDLVEILLKDGLIANASIDGDNVQYKIEQNVIVKSINSVITCQTKSLLFSHIEKLVRGKYGSHVPIYSLPITQSNESFDESIRNKTLKI
jgi:hypothetical protein